MYTPLLSFPTLSISNLWVSALEKQKLPFTTSSGKVEYFLIWAKLNKKLLCLIRSLYTIELLMAQKNRFFLE